MPSPRPWSWCLYTDEPQIYFFSLDVSSVVYNWILNCLRDIWTLWLWTLNSTFYVLYFISGCSQSFCCLYVSCLTVHIMTVHPVSQKEMRMPLIILTSNESHNTHLLSSTATLLSMPIQFSTDLSHLDYHSQLLLHLLTVYLFTYSLSPTLKPVHLLKLKSSPVTFS